MLQLAALTPLSQGHSRAVYDHPSDPTLLIKIIHEKAMASKWAQASWFRRRVRVGPYLAFVREFKEYVACYHAAGRDPLVLVRIVGLENSDLGPAQIVEKVSGWQGGIAPTLYDWVKTEGYTSKVESALQVLLRDLLDYGVIVSDLHAFNVAYGCDSRGGERLIMIDGFGERNAIPHYSMSRCHNALHTRRKFRRMVKELKALPSAKSHG